MKEEWRVTVAGGGRLLAWLPRLTHGGWWKVSHGAHALNVSTPIVSYLYHYICHYVSGRLFTSSKNTGLAIALNNFRSGRGFAICVGSIQSNTCRLEQKKTGCLHERE